MTLFNNTVNNNSHKSDLVVCMMKKTQAQTHQQWGTVKCEHTEIMTVTDNSI